MPRTAQNRMPRGKHLASRLADILQDVISQFADKPLPPAGFMGQLDRAAAVTRELALRAHGCAEAGQWWGQDPVVGGDRAAAPAEIVDLADPGEVPLDDAVVGRRLRGACYEKCRRGGEQSKMPMPH
jgi:hypothetical protein